MKKCEKCGMAGADDSMFCTNCGGNMVEINPTPEKEEPTSPMEGVVGEPVPASSPDSIVEEAGGDIELGKPARSKISKNTLMIIGMIVAVLIGIGGVVFGVVMANSKSSNSQKSTNTVAPTVITKTEVAVGDWAFTLPDGMEYSVSDTNALTYGDEDEWFAVTVYDDTSTYSNVANNLQVFAQTMADSLGMTIDETGTTDMDGTEFTWVDFVDKTTSEYCTVIVSEAGDMYSFITVLVNMDLSQDHEAFDDIAEVLGTAEKKTGSNIITDNSKRINDFIVRFKLNNA